MSSRRQTGWHALGTMAGLALFFGASGCQSTGGRGSDAGDGIDGGDPARDASAPEDAGEDGGSSMEDSGPNDRDAGDDGVGGDPGWVAFEGLPEGCAVEWAERPEEFWVPTLEPCPEDAPCQRIRVHGLGFAGITFRAGIGGVNDARGFFVGGVDFTFDTLRPKVVVADTARNVYAAFRNAAIGEPGVCGVGEVAFSANASHVAWVVKAFGSDFPTRELIFHSAVSPHVRVGEPVARFASEQLPGSSSIQELAASDTVVVAYVAPAARLYRIEVATGDVVLLTDSPASQGIPQRPLVIGDDVYWQDWRSNQVVLLRSVDGGPAEVLVEEEGVHHAAMAVDGDQVTWVRAEGRQPGGGFDDAEIFTASLAEDPLVRRSLGKVPNLSNIYRAGAGQYAYVWDDLMVVDVASGDRRIFDIPEGRRVGGSPMYVARDQLMIRMSLHPGDLGGAKLFDLSRFD